MIGEWSDIYRTTVEEPDGRTKSTWMKRGNRLVDWPFALAYSRIALSRMLGSASGTLLEPEAARSSKITDVAKSGGSVTVETISQAVADTYADMV
jgi:hypothetical protein